MPGRASIERFDYSKSEQYILSIRISADGFSFAVYHPQHYCFLLSVTRKHDNSISWLANLKQAYQEIEFLSYHYKQVYVLVVDKRFTYIPLEIYEENKAPEIFYYNFPKKENEIICNNVLVNNDCVVLYGMDNNFHSFLNDKYSASVQYYSQCSVITEYFSTRSRSLHTKQMFACLRDKYVDLYCFERGRIQLVNSYGECNSLTDFTYFILFVWKQLGMNQLTDKLYILGDMADKSELLEMLKEFIKDIVNFETEAELGNYFAGPVTYVPYDIQILMSQLKIR